MRHGAQSSSRRARATVLGALVAFVGLQLALLVAMSSAWPELRDPDYGARLERLERLVRSHPADPLLLVLGSSRAALGLRPDVLIRTWSLWGDPPTVFNFSRIAGGELSALLYLHRLLHREIHPDWLLLEVWPVFLTEQSFLAREDERIDFRKLQWSDWPVVARHTPRYGELLDAWWRAQLLPWSSQRGIIMDSLAPGWRRQEAFGEDFWGGLDAWGWRGSPSLTHARYRQELETVRNRWADAFTSFRPSARADAMIREILATCRERGILVTLLYLPEPSGLRELYTPESRASFEQYVNRLTLEYGTPRIDARDWLPDVEFGDAQHLTTSGAAAFTERLAAETGLPKRGRALASLREDGNKVSMSAAHAAQ